MSFHIPSIIVGSNIIIPTGIAWSFHILFILAAYLSLRCLFKKSAFDFLRNSDLASSNSVHRVLICLEVSRFDLFGGKL